MISSSFLCTHIGLTLQTTVQNKNLVYGYYFLYQKSYVMQ